MGLIGIDVGTTGCKATIIDFEGNAVKQAYREYNPESSLNGRHEINPSTVWENVKQVLYECVKGYNGEKIRAISVSSFGEAAVSLDRDGNILCNSILYIDPRGKEEAEYLEQRLGNAKVLEIAGTGIHPMYTINKVMWMKKHMQDTYNKTWKYLLFADFILYKLGARPHTDYSLAARTMALDIKEKKWSHEIFEEAQIDIEKFAEPVQAGTIVGEISREVADMLGLPHDVVLVAGGHDQACAALGAGVIKDMLAVDSVGTVECITPSFDRPVTSMKMAENNYVCVPHVIQGMYVTYAFTFTCGSILKWFRNQFGFEDKLEAERTGRNVYEVIISRCPEEPTNLLFLPHFAGAGTPYMDTESKGVIAGLDINTSRGSVIKSILEGVNFEMLINTDRFEEAGISIDELRVVGGLAKSETFLQLKANIMGKKVVSLNISEAGTLGVAILGGTACGIYSSIEDAVTKLVKPRKEFYPDEKIHSIYMEKYEKYKKVYDAVRVLF
ncbi:MAG TPA: hypothetical protein GXX14_01425 [Clostridiaceae bacterium]|nr:hypothetical protein [Clostridiaceae bacterium]